MATDRPIKEHNISNVKPWITEEYAKERYTNIDNINEGKRPFTIMTEKEKKEMISKVGEEATKFRLERQKKIRKMGVDDYIAEMVADSKKLIEALKNPAPEDKFKYTEDFFKEMIEAQQGFIDDADNLIKKMKSFYNKDEKEAAAIELIKFLKLPQATHTNNVAHKLAVKKSEVKKDLIGNGSIISDNFKLYIEGYDKIANGANTSTVKLFDAFIMDCGKRQDSIAKIPLDEYMRLRGLKDEKEARKQIRNDIEVLKSIKFEFEGTGKRKGDWTNLSLYGGFSGIHKGIIEFRFTPEFYDSVPDNQFLFIPSEYFSTKDKYNPHAAYFIRRIAEHKRMNLGKTNENIIGVETLINSSPTFPKYEDVYSQFTQKILNPFEKDMDSMTSIKWNYKKEQPTNYNEFLRSNIAIMWVDYPDVLKLTKKKVTPLKDKKRKTGG